MFYIILWYYFRANLHKKLAMIQLKIALFLQLVYNAKREVKRIMIWQLKEDRTHGSREYPYDQYYMRNIGHPFQIPVHWHEEIEIIYIEEGSLQVKIGDKEYAGRAGDVFFVNTRELHWMGTEDVNVRYYTILFPLTFISFQTIDDLESVLLAPIRNGQILFPEYIEEISVKENVVDILKKLTELNYYEKNGEVRQNILLGQHLQTRILILELLHYLYVNQMFVVNSLNRSSNLQKEMLMFIQEHYTEKVTLAMLAEEFHLSEKYVSRYFVENFHLPFSNYVIHLRLTEARKLLETTEIPVTDIALMVGFSNVSYFIRSFKSAYGTSPLKYRKIL